MGDNACERRLMVTPHFFDPNELMVLRQAMRPGFRFIDLGANVGAYTVFVGVTAGPGAKLLAIEPQRRLANRLRENLDLNGVEADVVMVGVSDHDGETEFTIDTNNLGFTSLKGDRGGRGKKHVSSFPVRRLSGLVADFGYDRIDALKADIEGAEDLALIPFIEDAPKPLWPRIIILEPNASEWRRDCVAFLKARGYEEVYRGGNVVLHLP
jgi:FkbM family methyltransferase